MTPSEIRKHNREKVGRVLLRAEKENHALQDEPLSLDDLHETPYTVLGALVAAYARIEGLEAAVKAVKP